jgi:hypothetical protein
MIDHRKKDNRRGFCWRRNINRFRSSYIRNLMFYSKWNYTGYDTPMVAFRIDACALPDFKCQRKKTTLKIGNTVNGQWYDHARHRWVY